MTTLHSEPQPGDTAGVSQPSSESSVLSDAIGAARKHLRPLVIGSVLGALLGLFLALSSAPIYVADSLIQIERGDAGTDLLSELSGAPTTDSSVSAQVQIVKSRSVIGEAVRALRLNVSATPVWAPWMGERLARIAPYLGIDDKPGYLGNAAWLGDELTLGRLDIDGADTMGALIRVDGPNAFTVLDSAKKPVVTGETGSGQAVKFTANNGALVNLAVRDIRAEPGVRFWVEQRTILAATKSISNRLRVSESGLGTGILKVSIEGRNKDQIRDIVNAVINAFLRQSVERRSEQAKRSLTFVTQQIPIVRADLEEAEIALQSFRADNQAIDLSAEGQSLLNQIVDLERRLSDLNVRRQELLRTVTKDHPLVQSVSAQIAGLNGQLKTLEEQASGLPQLQQQILRFAGDVEVARQLYTFLLDKAQELRVVEAGTVGNVRILDSAVTHPDPVRPRPARSFVLGAILGLLLAIGYVAVRAAMMRGITDPDAVERDLGLPVYAVVPHDPNAMPDRDMAGRPLTLTHPNAIASESIRSLRTALEFGIPSTGCSVLCMTSPLTNAGKTFICSNLAASLADSGRRVLVVDADMRRGNLHRQFSIEGRPGLSDLLSGRDLRAKPTEVETDVDVLVTGRYPPNPANLLLSDSLGDLVHAWRATYDLIIIDTPPVLSVTDAAIVSQFCDATFVIARGGRTTMDQLRETVRRLRSTTVTGIVINGLTRSQAAYTNYGGYDSLYEPYETDEGAFNAPVVEGRWTRLVRKFRG